MKRIPFTLFISVIFLLVLSACERPVPREETPEAPEAAPTTDVIIIPTAPPVTDGAYPGPAPDAGETGDAPTDTATTEDAAAAPETTDAAGEAPAETPAEQPATDTIHVVQAGDTVGRIAEFYGVSIEDIAVANGLANVDSLDIGQELIIRAGAAAEGGGETTTETTEGGEQVYVVQAGDNLFRIGLLYGVTAEELAAYNNIANPERIEIGQTIKIPPK